MSLLTEAVIQSWNPHLNLVVSPKPNTQNLTYGVWVFSIGFWWNIIQSIVHRFIFFNIFFYFLYCSGFCLTLKWNRHGFTCVPHPRSERDTCTPMFIATLFIIARTWKQPRCPSADEWIRKLWYIYTMEYYSAIQKNSFESVLMRWMKLEPVIQSEVSQKDKDHYNILTQFHF